jgi:hypothetical protein
MYITCLSHDTCPAIALRDTLRDCIDPSRRAHMCADVEYVRTIPTPETMTRMFSASASGALGIRRFAVMPYVAAITCLLGAPTNFSRGFHFDPGGRCVFYCISTFEASWKQVAIDVTRWFWTPLTHLDASINPQRVRCDVSILPADNHPLILMTRMPNGSYYAVIVSHVKNRYNALRYANA